MVMLDAIEIRRTRKRRRWQQEVLARRAGVSQATISKAERGERISEESLASIVEALAEPSSARTDSTALAIPAPDGPGAMGDGLAGPKANASFLVPKVSLSEVELPPPLKVTTWKRPEHSGDFVLVLSPSPGTVLLAAGDVAGHGASVVPSSMYLQGWLRGWKRGLPMAPRLPDLAQALSNELLSVGVDASCFLALLSRRQDSPNAVSYEGMSLGFPPPLLIAGPPFRTLDSCEMGPPLPVDRMSTRAVRIDRLHGPWRLVLATDGLLRRIGRDDERAGLKRLRKWNEGPMRDTAVERLLAPGDDDPVKDDELYCAATWQHWDRESAFSVIDREQRHQLLHIIEDKAVTAVGKERGKGLSHAVLEAMVNAWQHAYGGGQGIIRVRFSDDEQAFRVEIEDQGGNPLWFDKGSAKESLGFRIMRTHTSKVDVRQGERGGTIISLVLEK